MNIFYAAGLFDGEGWFEIHKSSGKKKRMKKEFSFQSRACLQMREKFLVEELQEMFGGKIYQYTPKNPKHSITYKWIVVGRECYNFSTKIEKYLLAKNKQASLIISFQTEKNLNGNKPLSDERYETYIRNYEEMKKLNKRGIGK